MTLERATAFTALYFMELFLPMALIKRDYVLKIYKIGCAKIQHTVGLLNTNCLYKTSLRHLGHVWPLKGKKGLKMGEKRRPAPYSSWILFGAGAGILEQSMGVRNREGTELSYIPARQPVYSLAAGRSDKLIPSPQILF